MSEQYKINDFAVQPGVGDEKTHKDAMTKRFTALYESGDVTKFVSTCKNEKDVDTVMLALLYVAPTDDRKLWIDTYNCSKMLDRIKGGYSLNCAEKCLIGMITDCVEKIKKNQ